MVTEILVGVAVASFIGMSITNYALVKSDWSTVGEIDEMIHELHRADDKIDLSSDPRAVQYSSRIKLREETIAKLQGIIIPKRKENATQKREYWLYELEMDKRTYKKWMEELTPTPS